MRPGPSGSKNPGGNVAIPTSPPLIPLNPEVTTGVAILPAVMIPGHVLSFQSGVRTLDGMNGLGRGTISCQFSGNTKTGADPKGFSVWEVQPFTSYQSIKSECRNTSKDWVRDCNDHLPHHCLHLERS